MRRRTTRVASRIDTPADGGSATVEFAMTLPAIAAMLVAIGVATQLGIATITAQDAASVAARVAMTDGDAQARESALEMVGANAEIQVDHDGEWIRVTVQVPAPWGFVARGSAVTRGQH
jgi:Flp pilus assembly protein TadG